MWWLDDGTLPQFRTSLPPTDDESAELARQLDAQTERCLAAEAQLEATRRQHAEELAELLQTRQDSEAALADLAARLQQHDSAHAAELAASTQQFLAIQSQLRTLEQTLAESEASRGDLQVAIAERDATLVAQRVELEQALASAVVRAEELAAHRISLEQGADELQLRLDTEIEAHAAADSTLEQCRADHAAELASRQAQNQSLQQALAESDSARSDLQTALTERDATMAAQLAEFEQARASAVVRADELAAQRISLEEEAAALQLRLDTEIVAHATACRELEQCRAVHDAELASRQAQIESLQQTLDTQKALQREHEAERSLAVAEAERAWEVAQQRAEQLDARLTAFAGEHAALQAILETSTREYEQHTKEFERQQHALQLQIESLSTRADNESESRVAAEAELQQLTEELRRLNDEAEVARGDYQQLQCQSAEKRAILTRNATRLQQDLEDCERQLQERDEQLACQMATSQQLQESERKLQFEKHQLSAQHAEQTALFESQVAELRSQLQSQAEAERASSARLEREQHQLTAELRQQLQEAIQRHDEDQAIRQRAEVKTDSLQQDVASLRNQVGAFRDFAQREAAARRKLEIAIKGTADTPDSTAALLAIRANLEVNKRIRRLTTELTAARNQELSVRQRAQREINRMQNEVHQLRDQLAEERKAA